MEFNNDNEFEPEGKINAIPKSINKSNKSIFLKGEKIRHFRQNSLNLNNFNSDKISEKDFENNDILNQTVKHNKNKCNLKSDDGISTASKSTINDKFKKVTFSTVEFIRVENYKKYNKLNQIKKADYNYNFYEDRNCNIF